MTTAALKAEWNKVRNLKRGMYSSPNATQQAGALLSQFSRPEAIAYAGRLIGPDSTPGQYWVQVQTLLINAN